MVNFRDHLKNAKGDVKMVKYLEGTIATRNVKEDYLEKEFGIPFKKKVIERLKKVNGYYGCLVTQEQYEAMCGHPTNFDELVEAEGEADAVVLQGKNGDIAWQLKMVEVESVYKLYSDGGSFNNGGKNPDLPQYGAYGAVVTKNGKKLQELSNGKQNWTNNIGELTGAIEVIQYIIDSIDPDVDKDTTRIVLCTDSQYVSKGCTEWMEGWIKRGWKNNAGQPTPNRQLWEKMKKILDKYDIRFRWVKGHTLFTDDDSQYNETCDILATAFLKEEFGVK
jgi:ribonuclease HI